MMNPRMEKLLREANGKTINIDVGRGIMVSGELKEVFPEYILIDVPLGSPNAGIRWLPADHIRWIGLPKD